VETTGRRLFDLESAMSNTYPRVLDCSLCGKPFWSSGSDICFPCSHRIEWEKKERREAEEKRRREEIKPRPIVQKAKPKDDDVPQTSAPSVQVSKDKQKEIARRLDLINRQRKTKAGYVYLMSSANGLYKIGRSKNVEQRRGDLNRQFPIQIGVIHSVLCKDYAKVERDLHSKYRQKRVGHEWFRLTPQDVAWFLALKDGDLDEQ
jgi:uncharacterized Zn finger protein (UPF0148 family)